MNIGESVGLIRDGRVRPLASAGPQRFAMTPDVPTFREGGFPLDTGVVRSLVAPAATPEPIRRRLEETIAATMRDAGWIAEADKLFIPLQYRTPRETREIVFREADTLRGVWQQQPWRDS